MWRYNMTRREIEETADALFAIGKGITYILLMAALIKYIFS